MTRKERLKKYDELEETLNKVRKEVETLSEEFRVKLLTEEYNTTELDNVCQGHSLLCPIGLLLLSFREHLRRAKIEAQYYKE